MDLRQLNHFVAVSEEMNFTRAARRMNIVQSALSSSIAALELELGAKLFHRTTRQVRMTAAGEAFYEKARLALDAVRQGREAVSATAGLERGRLMIGTVQSLWSFLDLPGLMAAFHARYPEVEVRMRQDNRMVLAEQVLAGKLDAAFLPVVQIPPSLRADIVVDDPMVLICAPDHPLARRSSIAMDGLDGQRFIDFQPGWGTRAVVDEAFAEAGAERRTMFEVSNLETLIAMVVRGLGVALAPQSNVEASGLALSVVKLSRPAHWRMMVVYAADAHGAATSPVARAFVDVLNAVRSA